MNNYLTKINRLVSLRLKLYMLTLVLVFGLSSCFEVIEEVSLNGDGSGSIVYTLNMSQSKIKLHQLMRLDSINGYKIPSEKNLSDTLDYYFEIAKGMQGLSNFNKSEDFEEMIFSFSFDFDNLNALNAAVRKMDNGKDHNISQDHYSYNQTDNFYRRSGDYRIKKEFDKLRSIDKAIFNNAKFISIFRSELEIETMRNPHAQLAPTKKAVMLMIPILELVNEKKNITNTIIFKP